MPYLHPSLLLVMFMAACQLPAHAEPLKLVTYHFPPYSAGDKNDATIPAGPLVTLVREICKAAAVECQIEIVPWLRAQEYLRGGRADGIFPITPNPAWNDRITYTEAVATGEYGVFVQQASALNYRTPADLHGTTIAVQGPSNMSSVLESLQQQAAGAIAIERRPDVESGFRKLLVGRVDAVFANRALGDAVVTRMHEKGVRYAGTTTRIDYYVGFASKLMDKDNVQRFARVAAEMGATGRISQIMSQQAGTAQIAPKGR